MSKRKLSKPLRSKMKNKMIIKPKKVSIGHSQNPHLHQIHSHKNTKRLKTRASRNRRAIQEG